MAVTVWKEKQLQYPIQNNYSAEIFNEMIDKKQVNTDLEKTVDYLYINQMMKSDGNNEYWKTAEKQADSAQYAESYKLYEKLDAVGYGQYFRDKVNGGGGFFDGMNITHILLTAGLTFAVTYGLSKILK